MDLGLSDEQQELVASFATLLAKASSPDQVRAAEPLGFDAALWTTLRDIGVLSMAVPESRGGWGASRLDLVLVAEQLGRTLAPAPVTELQVALRLLAAAGTPSALECLGAGLRGERLPTLVLQELRDGDAPLVPAGAVCDAVVALIGDRLLMLPVAPGDRRHVTNLGSAPLADLRLDPTSGQELAGGAEAVALFEVATDDWLLLTAATLVGISAAAHEIVCAYAAERTAFGGIIGGYQGVAHPLADDATAIDGARLLVQKAAWAFDVGDARARELAAMAFAFGSETAERATYDAIHFLGGYGFMLEHDVQLFYRRARTWARVWGDAERAYARAADARYGPSLEAAS